MTRLELIISLFGWQGGTVHQVNRALQKHFNWPRECSILNMSESAFYTVVGNVALTKYQGATEHYWDSLL